MDIKSFIWCYREFGIKNLNPIFYNAGKTWDIFLSGRY